SATDTLSRGDRALSRRSCRSSPSAASLLLARYSGRTTSPTRMTPSLRICARSPPRWTSAAMTPSRVSPSRYLHGSQSRVPRRRTSPTRKTRSTRWLSGTRRESLEGRRARRNDARSAQAQVEPAVRRDTHALAGAEEHRRRRRLEQRRALRLPADGQLAEAKDRHLDPVAEPDPPARGLR